LRTRWRTGGVPVPRESFREDLLPPHLRMNCWSTYGQGVALAQSRRDA
jgi:hypothetical protein